MQLGSNECSFPSLNIGQLRKPGSRLHDKQSLGPTAVIHLSLVLYVHFHISTYIEWVTESKLDSSRSRVGGGGAFLF